MPNTITILIVKHSIRAYWNRAVSMPNHVSLSLSPSHSFALSVCMRVYECVRVLLYVFECTFVSVFACALVIVWVFTCWSVCTYAWGWVIDVFSDGDSHFVNVIILAHLHEGGVILQRLVISIISGHYTCTFP